VTCVDGHHCFPLPLFVQVGVSESIIMGIPMPTGTGLFKVRHNVGEVGALIQRPPPLLTAY
jgi:hypothetical protein